jgi:1-acyl-sn-glycerol-3-phosphate acyltransferase
VRLVRSLLFVVWLYLTMLAIGLVGIVARLVNPRAIFWAQKAWSQAALWGLGPIAGVWVKIEGRENLPVGPLLLAAKHQAQLDTIVPFVLFEDAAFVLKQELLKTPVFGWYVGNAGHIPIDRTASAAALKAMLRAARPARDAGRAIIIFPEGTRQKAGDIGEYKPGVAALYRDLNVPCVPVALDSGRSWPPSGFLLTPGDVTFKILPPIPPGLSRDDFMTRLQDTIETESAALLAAPQPKRPRRLGLYAPWLLFIAAAAGYWVYWSSLRDTAIQRIDAAIGSVRAGGGAAGYRTLRVDGFPMRLSLHLHDVTYAPKAAGYALAAPHVTLHVNPAEPRHLIGAVNGPATVRLGVIDYAVRGDVIAASRRPARSGAGEEDVFDLRGATIAGPAGEAKIESLFIGARPDPRKAGDRQISVEAKGLALPAGLSVGPFGRAIAEGHARLVDDGAGLRVEGFKAIWGPATLSSASGRLLLSGAAVSGAMDARIENPTGAAGKPAGITMKDGVISADGVGVLAKLTP